MALKQRNQQLALAAELLQVHLPAVIETGDDKLARDLLCAFMDAIDAVTADVEAAAQAWVERGNLGKAEALRREWVWTDSAIQYINALVRSENPVDVPRASRVAWLIPFKLEAAARPKISDPTNLRGACQARKEQQKAAKKASGAKK